MGTKKITCENCGSIYEKELFYNGLFISYQIKKCPLCVDNFEEFWKENNSKITEAIGSEYDERKKISRIAYNIYKLMEKS